MPRFYFDLEECGTRTVDEEGRDCADLAAAKAHAVASAREIMCAEVTAGRLCLACRVEISDGSRRHVLTVTFREAIEITGL